MPSQAFVELAQSHGAAEEDGDGGLCAFDRHDPRRRQLEARQ